MHPLVLLHGSVRPLRKPVKLQAGKLTLEYEGGFLRYIKIGETEVLRMINHYIRDEHWANIPMVITGEKIETNSDGFSISYTADCIEGNVLFRWNCVILGKADSSVTFTIEGTALSPFKRNRLGFTVLHPIDTVSGKECVILHSDRTKETRTFPEYISPFQPFFDITGMYWQPADRLEAEVHFIGDIFETEDQRNWCDDSFKTYCTPLARPFPVSVKKGDRVSQSVHFKVTTKKTLRRQEEPLTFAVERQTTVPFPPIGLTLKNLNHDERAVQNLKELGVDFLRVEVRRESELAGQLQQALKIGLPLEIVLFAKWNFGTYVVNMLAGVKDRIARIVVLPADSHCTNAELIGRIVPTLRQNFPECMIGGGTDAFFTEINRERTPPELLDFLTFSINPQAHAVDLATVTENLKPQREVVRTCRTFAGGKGVHIGPVTLRTRRNPGATSEEEKKSAKGGLPDSVDPRQLSLYCAGWTMGSIKYLAESGAGAITYFQTCGWSGIMPHRDQPWPGEFKVDNEQVYPVYIILKEILRHKSKQVVRLVMSNPLKADGLAFVSADRQLTIFLANYTDEIQTVSLPAEVRVSHCRIIDAGAMEKMTLNAGEEGEYRNAGRTISLPPFAMAILQ